MAVHAETKDTRCRQAQTISLQRTYKPIACLLAGKPKTGLPE